MTASLPLDIFQSVAKKKNQKAKNVWQLFFGNLTHATKW